MFDVHSLDGAELEEFNVRFISALEKIEKEPKIEGSEAQKKEKGRVEG